MLVRAAAALALLLLWWALGPLVVVVAMLSLAAPQVRGRIRVEHPWRDLGYAAGAALVLAVFVVVVPDGRLPIPQGPGRLVSPAYVGRPAIVHPIAGMEVPQHPHLAANGRSSGHNDAWASGAYEGAGPRGERPEVDTAWFGLERCATLAFDRDGRIVTLCGERSRPRLKVLDPESMHTLAEADLPEHVEVDGARPWEDLCGGSSFYLDERDRAVVATTDRRVLVYETRDGQGEPDLTVAETYDVRDLVPDDDCLVAVGPDWDGALWFVTRQGRVGAVDTGDGAAEVLDLQEEVTNSFAVDEAGGVYVVTTRALYRLEAGPGGAPEMVWREQYDYGTEQKPGQLSRGSGTTPTLLPGGLVAITDNADPVMNVVFHRRDTGAEVCREPVFDDGGSATESSLAAVGRGVVVENNHGYAGPLSTFLGFSTTPGFARVDVVDGACETVWTNADVAGPSSAAKVSLANGLVYAYTKRPSLWGVAAWYLTALDAHTGRHVFSVRTGTGTLLNGHHAAVSLGPDGSAYVATLAGLVRVSDREVEG